MSNPPTRSSRSVFVGNIPYDATEEQLKELFQEVGPVVSFRLVFDRETGKPKGYGFCEYRDVQTAMSAMRNLNGHDMNGRPLRVDFAENEKGMDEVGRTTGSSFQPGSSSSAGSTSSSTGSNSLSPNQQVQADLSKVLESMSTAQLYEIMIQMKGLIQKNPEHVRQLLANNPQFAYALLQAQVVLGMITPEVANQVMASQQSVATNTAQAAGLSPAGITGGGIGNLGIGVMSSVLGANALPTVAGLLVNPLLGQQSGLGFGFPGGGFPMGGMILPQQQSQPQAEHLGVDEQQLLEKLLSLTDEQLEQLPPEERRQIIEVRKTMINLINR